MAIPQQKSTIAYKSCVWESDSRCKVGHIRKGEQSGGLPRGSWSYVGVKRQEGLADHLNVYRTWRFNVRRLLVPIYLMRMLNILVGKDSHELQLLEKYMKNTILHHHTKKGADVTNRPQHTIRLHQISIHYSLHLIWITTQCGQDSCVGSAIFNFSTISTKLCLCICFSYVSIKLLFLYILYIFLSISLYIYFFFLQ